MSKGVISHIIRFLILLVLQVLLFRSINLGISELPHFSIFIYPIFILALPLNFSKELALLLAFVMGILIDVWYQTPGVHSSALIMATFARPYILGVILDDAEQRQNFNKDTLTMKLTSYIVYALIFFVIHIFIYFFLEAFTFVQFGATLIKTIFSTIFSFTFAFIYILVSGYS